MQFSKINDNYLRDRFDDVRHVCGRILGNLQKIKKKKKSLFRNKILVASEFSPADLLTDSKAQISGLVSVFGGPGGFEKLREACRKNIHLVSSESELVAPSYDTQN